MRPPRFATWLLKRFGPANEALLGDLLEAYGDGRSARWYWRQVLIALCVGRRRYLPRVTISALAIACGVLVAVTFLDPVVEVILRALSLGGRVTYREAGGPTRLAPSVAMLTGFVLAMPVLLYQVGLASTASNGAQRRLAARFAVGAAGCFMIGALLSHVVLFPWIYQFGLRFMTDDQLPPRLWGAYSLYAELLLVCGLAFQMPATAFFLARVRVITPRFLVRNFGYAVALLLVVVAVLTPTHDSITLTVATVPLVACYSLCVLLAHGGALSARRAASVFQ